MRTYVLANASPCRTRSAAGDMRLELMLCSGLQITMDEGHPRDVFSGPTTLNVPAGQQGSYPLKFAPPWIGTYSGALVLSMPATLESATYRIVGKGLEPAAADHVKVAAVARSTKTIKVEVANPASKSLDFKVFTDLANLSGPDRVSIGAKSSVQYTMKYTPAVSGTFSGTLTFSSRSGEFVWFTLEAAVVAAPQAETICVACPGAPRTARSTCGERLRATWLPGCALPCPGNRVEAVRLLGVQT
jgi:hypothetical protein